MGIIEKAVQNELDRREIIEQSRKDPEKLGGILKNYIDSYVGNADLEGLNMLLDFIQKNLDTPEHKANNTKLKIALRNRVMDALGSVNVGEQESIH